MKTFRFAAVKDNLPAVMDCVERTLPEEYAAVRSKVLLVVEELFMNVVMHGVAGRSVAVTVSCGEALPWEPAGPGIAAGEGFGPGRAGLCLRFADNGPAYNPFARARQPDLSLDAEQRPLGGLGLHLIRRVSGGQRYARRGDLNVVEIFFPRPEQ